MKFRVLLLLFFVSCYPCHQDGVVTQESFENAIPPEYVDLAIQVVREKMPCSVPLSGDIWWMNSPTDREVLLYCGRPAWGCADPWSCRFYVWIATYNPKTFTYIQNVWETALINEIGYWVWDQCYDRMPERYVDGIEILDPDFVAWMNEVNLEIKNRSLAP
jgi:hypothetical protein